jgi:hypothetical protein
LRKGAEENIWMCDKTVSVKIAPWYSSSIMICMILGMLAYARSELILKQWIFREFSGTGRGVDISWGLHPSSIAQKSVVIHLYAAPDVRLRSPKAMCPPCNIYHSFNTVWLTWYGRTQLTRM